jgi:hypothetical protein
MINTLDPMGLNHIFTSRLEGLNNRKIGPTQGIAGY